MLFYNLKRGVLLTISLCALWLPLRGQADDATGLSIQIRVISLDETLTALTFLSNNKRVALALPPFAFSEGGNYTGPKTLDLYKATAPAKDAPLLKVGSVVLPAEAKRVLLMVAAKADGSLAIAVLPDDPDKFPAGKARLYNATPYALAISCDGVLVQLAPGETSFASGNQNKIILKLAYSYSKDGNWIRAGNNVFSLRPTIRQSIFFIASNSNYFNMGAGRKRGVHMVPLEEEIKTAAGGGQELSKR